MNPVRHVVIAMSLTAVLFLIAGDRWNERVKMFRSVKPAPKAKAV